MSFTAADRTSPLAAINVTPLVDVMLVLLIIFMITAPVVAHRVTIDLPQVVDPKLPPPPPVDPERLELAVDGTLLWNGQPMPQAALEPQLALLARAEPQPTLEFGADATTSYALVAEVLAAAKRAGVRKVGFMNMPAG